MLTIGWSNLQGKGPLNDILADVILLGQVEKLPEITHDRQANSLDRRLVYTGPEKYCVVAL